MVSQFHGLEAVSMTAGEETGSVSMGMLLAQSRKVTYATKNTLRETEGAGVQSRGTSKFIFKELRFMLTSLYVTGTEISLYVTFEWRHVFGRSILLNILLFYSVFE